MPINYTYDDIHERSFTETIHNKLKQDILRFANEKSKLFVKNDVCPACSSTNTEYTFTSLKLDYFKCSECKTLFVNPCPKAAEIVDYLNTSEGPEIWRTKMPPEVQKTREKLYESRSQFIKEQIDFYGYKNPTLIDVGGGSGELCLKLQQLQTFHEIHVIEPQPLNIDMKNIFIHQCIFEEFQDNLLADCIVSFEVLEHLIDPMSFLEKANSCLKPGGILIFTTPNSNSFEVDLLGEKSTQVPFDHIRLYNPKALEIMFSRLGSFEVKITTPGVFDVELVLNAMPVEDKIIQECLEFIFNDTERKKSFQKFLVETNRSSHMSCVARKL